MSLPLEGVRIIDLSQFQQGPWATAMLADFGADVIKVEMRVTGEGGRAIGRPPVPTVGNLNPYFETLNRNKRSITVDVRKPEGKEIVLKLAAGADVFWQNFRVGVAERLGLGYEDLCRVNPSIVYVSGSGLGPKGPLATKPLFDTGAQAMGGIMWVSGMEGSPEVPVGASIADQASAMFAAYGVMVALFHRQKTGEGQRVDYSLLGGQIGLQAFHVASYLFSGALPSRQGRGRIGRNTLAASFEAKDGRSFVIVVLGKGMDKAFETIGVEHLLGDPRFETNALIEKHRHELFEIMQEAIKKRTRDEWIQALEAVDVVCAPVYDYAETANHPQTVENNFVVDFNHPKAGPIKVVPVPLGFSKTPVEMRRPAPEVGEHTAEILREIGYSETAITALRASEIV